jgi:FkbM family methyltransferase
VPPAKSADSRLDTCTGGPQRLGARARVRRTVYFVSLALRFLREEPNKGRAVRLAGAAVLLTARGGLRRPPRAVALTLSAPRGGSIELKVWTFVDLLVVREIFFDGEYRLPDGVHPRTILDLGANIGISTLFFRSVFPEAYVIAVEPDPTQFRRLELNVGGDSQVLAIRAAATPHSGPVAFYQAVEGWRSSLERPDGIGAVQTSVPGLTVEDLLARAGVDHVDLVKVDIEGGEWPLLEQGALQDATDLITGELHRDDPVRASQLLSGWRMSAYEAAGDVATFTAARLDTTPSN